MSPEQLSFEELLDLYEQLLESNPEQAKLLEEILDEKAIEAGMDDICDYATYPF